MSTTEVNAPQILDENEVANPVRGTPVWRFSEGKLARGREQDGTLETREKIVGVLRRISVHSGVGKNDGVPYAQLEIDVETAKEGTIRVKAGLTDRAGDVKPSVAAITFAEGLLDLAKDEPIMVCANRGTKPNKFGNYSTYANLYHVDPATKRPRETARRPRSDEPMATKWERLEKELQTHPAYADRPKGSSDDGPETHFEALEDELRAKGWPTPTYAPNEWLNLLAAFFKHDRRASIKQYADDQWQVLRQALEPKKPEQLPGLLKPAMERLKKDQAAAVQTHVATAETVVGGDPSALDDGYDPFAEE